MDKTRRHADRLEGMAPYPELKRCSSCRRYLPRSAFYKNGSNASGLQARCKACLSADQKARYERMKRKVLWEGLQGAEHGTPQGYRKGCRCPECKDAIRRYYEERRRV